MQHEYSDIDVALVTDDFSGIGYFNLKKIVKSLKKYIQIQPITYSVDEFNAGYPFIDEIKKNRC